jgi:hypothetical protein
VIGSSLGTKASSSVVTLADSSKHIIQIVQLLEERRMNFTFCLNKSELLLLSGFGLLYQGLDLKSEGKLIRENQRLICSVIEILERNSAPSAQPFKKLAWSITGIERSIKGHNKNASSDRKTLKDTMTAPSKSTKKQLQALASRFSIGHASTKQPQYQQPEPPQGRRSTHPTFSVTNLGTSYSSQASLSSTQSEPIIKRANSDSSHTPYSFQTHTLPIEQPNLDYLPFDSHSSRPTTSETSKPAHTAPPSDWEHLLGFIESGQGFSSSHTPTMLNEGHLLSPYVNTSPGSGTNDWSPEAWELREGFSGAGTAQSVLSLSEESLTSGEEFSSSDYATEYRGIMMPNLGDEFGLEAGFNI